MVERICWIVPRDSLRLQAEEAFADPIWRAALGHAPLGARRGERARPVPRPRRLRHHLPGRRRRAGAAPRRVSPPPQPAGGGRGPPPALARRRPTPATPRPTGGRLVERHPAAAGMARVRLLLSGTLERADGRSILWLPYRAAGRARRHARGRSRCARLGGGRLLPRRSAGRARRAARHLRRARRRGKWLDEERRRVGPHASPPARDLPARPVHRARTGFAEALPRRPSRRPASCAPSAAPSAACRPGSRRAGLGKLLVVAPDQANARRYLDLRPWPDAARRAGEREARLAISDAARGARGPGRLPAAPGALGPGHRRHGL